jgi:hypothetical protein
MKDTLVYTFNTGYFNTGNYVEVPQNSFIYPSSNVIFDKTGRLYSFRGLSTDYSYGGTRAFALDANVVGFMGTTSTAAIGNMLQGVEKSLWFVGNELADSVSVIKDINATPALISIGGNYSKETVTIASSTSFAHTYLSAGTNDAYDAVSYVAHGFKEGQKVTFEDAGSGMPTGISAATTYYVKLTLGADAFQISSSSGGSALPIGSDTSVRVKSPQIQVTVTSSKVTGSPVTVLVDLATSGETATTVATKVRNALRSNTAITDVFYVTSSSGVVTLEDKESRVNDFNVAIPSNLCGVTAVTSSTSVTAGSADTLADLSTTAQVARWNGSSWDNPVDVGLPEFDNSSTPSLELTTVSTRSTGFEGLVKGSRSVRVARKRYETIGLATASSVVVTASETGDSLVVSIPAYDKTLDKSPRSQNHWVLYLTYKGQGSTATHKRFPLYIPEEQLDGSVAASLAQDGNAKYKVISQHNTDQTQRLVEIEFNDNELLLDVPQDDTYPLEPCKFLAKLGNVMCGIGVGDDSTGFDVSYPNEHEAYPPEWRDWFAEVPVGIASQEDMGFFWVCSANNTYIAKWTGVTEGSAPVIIEKVSQLYGTIGQGALLSVFGVLYVLSNGKTPVAISPDGQVNDQFGAHVRGAFTSYTSDTQIIWDEATATIIYACGTSAIGYNMLTKQWTAPVTLGDNSIKSGFSINGHARLCFISSGTFITQKWDGGTNPTNNSWNVTGTFQFGKYGRALKDIIQVETILTSDQATSNTITFAAYKNYSVASATTLATTTLSTSGSLISVREYTEDLDYDTIAASISGTKGGQTIHNASYTVDVHRIERVS